MRRPSLRRVLSSWFLVILTVTIALLGAIVYITVDRHTQQRNQARLRATALAGLAQVERESEDPESNAPSDPPRLLDVGPSLDTIAPRLVEAIGSRYVLARILTRDGQVMASSTATVKSAPPPTEALRDKLSTCLSCPPPTHRGHRLPLTLYTESAGDRDWLVMLIPLYHAERAVGVLQVAMPSREQRRVMSTLAWTLLAGGLLALSLGLGAADVLSRRLSSPLERIEETARAAARGDLSARTHLTAGTRETREVADALDDMIARLQQSLAAQRRFVADASHELKTPLTAISGMAEMLRTGRADASPEQRAKALRTIEAEIDKMARLVSDLLTLSKSSEAEAPLLARTSIDVRALIESATASAQDAISNGRLRLVEFPQMTVEGDADMLSRAIRNLVDNALAYSPPTGTVTVRAESANAEAVIEVIDEGPGISAEDLPRVFDRFYRADASRSRQTGGAGLGLPIVAAIAQQHGGRVALHSAPGQGTRACLHLPRKL